MFVKLVNRARQMLTASARVLQDRLRSWTKPPSTSLALESIRDLARSKPQLVIENALLRQQLLVLNRSAKRPRLTRADRLPAETIALIRAMAGDNRLWGADRIQGELLKLNITVAKRTIQRYMHRARPQRPRGQTWTTFLRNHAKDIWAGDFLQVHDLFFRPLFAFVLTELGSRRIVHVGVTRSPTDAWVAQQLREATPFGEAPTYLIRDNDAKYGPHFAAVATGSGIEVLRTPIQAPRANAICERLVGSVRRECLDHILVMSEVHLRRVLGEYVTYFNRSRPHQGIDQRVPVRESSPDTSAATAEDIVSFPVLGGLHHEYRRVA